MPDGTNVIYVYDGSFDGLMCCVAEAEYRCERPEDIVPEEERQESLFEPRYIKTEPERADRVKKEIRSKISNNALHFVKKSFLTALDGKEIKIFDFITDGFERGYIGMSDIAGEKMNALYNAVRALENEAELLSNYS